MSRDEPKKKGIFLYLTLYFRHFFDFIKMNLLYFAASIPLIIVLFFTTDYIISLAFGNILKNLEALGYLQIKIWVILAYLLLYGSGPASMGFAYMCKCVTEEKHTFIFHDFKKKFLENFKHGMFIMIIDQILVCFAFPAAIYLYRAMYIDKGNMLFLVLMTLMTLFFAIYTQMHFYFYQFAVGYELGFVALLRNSFLMSIAGLPMNLFFMLLTLVVSMLATTYLMALLIFVVPFLILSLVRYPIDFYTSRKIARIMTNNIETKQNEM